MKLNRNKWVILSFALFATILNYVDRLSFNYLSATGPLRDLLSDEAFGYIGTAFFVAYMCSNLLSGWAIDRLKTRLGYSLSMFIWTTATLFHSIARTPFQFGMARFALGVGEAGNWPAAVKLVGEWFSPAERATASGIFNSGSAIGAILAPIVIGFLIQYYSWNYIFIFLAAIGYIWIILFWITYRSPFSSGQSEPNRIPILALIKNRFVIGFTLSKFFLDPVWYFITFWIGRYLVDVHHLDLVQMASLAIVPFVVADAGNILGGVFTQLLINRFAVPVPKARTVAVIFFGTLLTGSLVMGPLFITSPFGAILVLSIAAFSNAAYIANSLAFPADVVPQNATASVWGIASVGAGLGGAVFQALSGIGVSVLTERFGYATAYHTIFLGYGMAAAIGISIVLFFIGPLQKSASLEKIAQRHIDSKLTKTQI